MTVLHIINSMKPGGAETLLANSLAKDSLQNYVNNILVYFNGDSALLDRLDKRVKVINLGYNNFLGLPKLLYQLKKIIKENKVSIIHTHLNPSSIYTHLICPKNIPHVHTIHTTYSIDKETRGIMLWLEKTFYLKTKKANCILLTEYSKTDFLNAIPFKGKEFVLGNFIPDVYFENSKKENTTNVIKLLAVGRLSVVKNYYYLLNIFKHLKNTPIQLDIYGGGDANEYKNSIVAEGLNVRMMGLIKDTSTIYQNYDAFIMPSLFEGFPLSMMEAMANELPCILSDIPPLKTLAKEAATYITLADAALAAEQITHFFSNKKLVNEIASKGQKFAEQNGKKSKYIQELLSIYEQLTS